MMLVSTSRKPNDRTRQFARQFARASCAYIKNRGKSNLDEVLVEAEKLGCDRIAIVSEQHGNIDEISVFTHDGWQNPVIKVLGYKLGELPRRLPTKEVVCLGDDRVADVFNFLKTEKEAESVTPVMLNASEKELVFTLGKDVLLQIKRGVK